MLRNVEDSSLIAACSARTQFLGRGGGLVRTALFTLAMGVSVANAQIAYDNTSTVFFASHSFGSNEGGDQITLDGTSRVVTEIELGFEAPIEIVPMIVRIYANDGPISLAPGAGPEPGTLLFDSGVISVNATNLGFNTFTVAVPNVVVPDTITWTMEIDGPRALSLSRFSPPTVGTSSDFIWTHNASGSWSPNDFPGNPDSFYAKVTAGNPAADDATCDGVDDDCDGVVDEDFVSTATSCGVGACASTGSTSCVGGAVQDSCTPGAATDELCDGIDNDCDGVSDEDFAAPVATASLVPISGGDDEGTEGGDDDEGRFVVAFGFSNQATACAPTTCTGQLVCGASSFAVDPGEIVEIENDDEECEAEVEDGFLELEGPNILLEVTCTNSKGTDTAQASPIGIAADNDSEDEFDD